MFDVAFDMREFRKKARQVGVYRMDQLPFALSRSLNDAVFATRKFVVSTTWPRAMTVRNKRFISAALRVMKSNKRMLRVELYDHLGRGQLARHAEGGTKLPRGGSLAIPNQQRIRLTGSGAKPRPRSLDARIPKRALRVVPGKGIFVGEGGRLHPLYLFASSASIEERFEFYTDFRRIMQRELGRSFPINIRRAVRTAFY